MVAETHARRPRDIVRELIDGAAGLRLEKLNLPDENRMVGRLSRTARDGCAPIRRRVVGHSPVDRRDDGEIRPEK